MNPVLQYAIEHQAAARTMLIGQRIPLDELGDVYQYALMRVLVANPRNRKGPASYWYKTLRTAVADYWRRLHRDLLPFDGKQAWDGGDPHQDLDRQMEVSERLRQVREVCGKSPATKRALTVFVRGEPMDNAKRQRLHHLRKRLRAAVA